MEEETEYSIYCVDVSGDLYIAHLPTYLAKFWEEELKKYYTELRSKVIPYTEDIIYIYQKKYGYQQLTESFHPIGNISKKILIRYPRYINLIPHKIENNPDSYYASSYNPGSLIKIEKYKSVRFLYRSGNGLRIEDPYLWFSNYRFMGQPTFLWSKI